VLEEASSTVTINCYPNPFSDQVSAQLTEPLEGASRVEILNSMGQKVLEYTPAMLDDVTLQVTQHHSYYVMKIFAVKKWELVG
jgi:hypothetical protein